MHSSQKKFRHGLTWKSVFGIAAILYSTVALSATRTIQFAGVAGADYQRLDFSHQVASGYCVLTIANTGATAQQVNSLSFIQYDTTNNTNWITWNSGNVTGVDAPLRFGAKAGGGNLAKSCFAQDLQRGDYCVITWPQVTQTSGGKPTMVCSGSIQVQDSVAATPGSLVAAGATLMAQESLVLGGVLSGIYYQNAPILASSDIQAGTGFVQLPGNTTYPGSVWQGGAMAALKQSVTGNMNYICTYSCIAVHHMSYTGCYEACGFGLPHQKNMGTWGMTAQGGRYYKTPTNPLDDSTYTTMPNTFSIEGLVSVEDPFSGTSSNFPADSLGTARPFTGEVAINGPVGSPPGSGDSSNGGNGPQANYASPTATNYKLAIFKGNPLFGGGMTYEIEMGPLLSICSGNTEYWNSGGLEVTHADGMSNEAGNTGVPTERNFCAHRHGRGDLFSRVSSSSGFTVNGGMPF